MTAAYHMRRRDREITDPAAIEEILRKVKYLTIGLCDGGEPYVVPLSCGYDGRENAFYFHCARSGHKLDVIASNPMACASAVDDRGYAHGECSHKYRSLVIRGRMEKVTDQEGMEHGIRVLLEQLEGEGDEVYAGFIKGRQDYANVAILKLAIDSVTAKGNA